MSASDQEQQSHQAREATLVEQFYRSFQHEVAGLRKRIDDVADPSLTGTDRATAIENCLSSIAHLSQEVKDAGIYIPAYDQRTYTETIKGLTERLQTIRNKLAPRPKFSFKNAKKVSTAAHPSPAMEATGSAGYPSSMPLGVVSNTSPQISSFPSPGLNNTKTLLITSLSGQYIRSTTPSQEGEASPSSGTLAELSSSIVDLTRLSEPLATATVKLISSSVLICGRIVGPLHITSVQRSILVVSCHQFRMHDCKNVDVYLHCRSRPIIERCNGIRFAPLPTLFIQTQGSNEDISLVPNHWDQIDDFTWLKQEASPHWSVLPEAERLGEGVWEQTVGGVDSEKREIDSILASFGVQK